MRVLYFLVLLLVGCSPKFKIQTDTPSPGDFGKYKSFKFYNPNNLPGSNFSFKDSDKTVIFDAVGDEMKSRGYSSIQDADLMIKIQGGTKNTVEIKNDDRYYSNGYNSYNNNRYGNYDNYNNRPRDESKKETSIIIDIIDINIDKVVWHGVGLGTLGKKEELTEIKIREAITSMFAEYPYRAGTSN